MASPLTEIGQAGPFRIKPEQAGLAAQHAQACTAELRLISPGKSTSTAADWLQSLGQQLAFPAHFGNNFDALYDCLCDPDVLKQPRLVLIIDNLDALDEEEADTLIAVLQAAADEWREQNRALWSLFAVTGLDLDPLPLKPLA